jgi:hypothetical protein
MTQEYTPTGSDIKSSYIEGSIGDGSVTNQDDDRLGASADFDRWLAAHDAQIRADALKLTVGDIRAGCFALSDGFHEQGIGPLVVSPKLIEIDPLVKAVLSGIAEHRKEQK